MLGWGKKRSAKSSNKKSFHVNKQLEKHSAPTEPIHGEEEEEDDAEIDTIEVHGGDTDTDSDGEWDSDEDHGQDDHSHIPPPQGITPRPLARRSPTSLFPPPFGRGFPRRAFGRGHGFGDMFESFREDLERLRGGGVPIGNEGMIKFARKRMGDMHESVLKNMERFRAHHDHRFEEMFKRVHKDMERLQRPSW